MNEFFVKLLNKYSKDGFVNLNAFEFKLAIDEACQAQRNACARAYLEHNKTELIPNTLQRVNEIVRNERTIGVIMRSEITEADYE